MYSFKVEYIFEKFDLDRDGKLSMDEFIEGCLRDEYLSNLFKTTFMGSSVSYGDLATAETPTSASANIESRSSALELPVIRTAPKPRSNSVNDTGSTTSSSTASDATKNSENEQSLASTNKAKLFKRNALKIAKKTFGSHHNLAFNVDTDSGAVTSQTTRKLDFY